MAGRRTKRTPKLEAAVLRALRGGATRTAAAEHVGIHRDRLWRWTVADPAFRDAVTRAEAEAEIAYTKIMRDAATADWRAAFAWLERRRHQDYGRIDRVEVTIRETAAKIAAQTGADPDWLVARAEEIAREAQASKT